MEEQIKSLSKEKKEQPKAHLSFGSVKKARILKAKVWSMPPGDLLTAQNLKVGTLLLGVVREIYDLYIIVSLPFNMQGRVQIIEISDVLHDKLSQVCLCKCSGIGTI
jgi:hypothetical protein